MRRNPTEILEMSNTTLKNGKCSSKRLRQAKQKEKYLRKKTKCCKQSGKNKGKNQENSKQCSCSGFERACQAAIRRHLRRF